MASLAQRNGQLGRRLSAHLLRRISFGPKRAEIDDMASKTADEAVDLLMNFPLTPPPPLDPATGLTWVVSGRTGANSDDRDLKDVLGGWWLHQIFDPALPISAMQKVFFFLHCSFSTRTSLVEYSENHYYTLRLLYHYIDKSYKDLALKICLDNGMSDTLDIGDSEKESPNENFVREFFELHTIGKGPTIGEGDYTTFTEQDVQEAAKIMTGFRRNDAWNDPLGFDPDTGLPRATSDIGRHDTSDKIFSSAFQDTIIAGQTLETTMIVEVQDFVNMIFAQEATAKEITRRMYRFFVRSLITQEVEDDIIAPLAQSLMSNNYVILPVLKTLLKSEHFYDAGNADETDEIVGALIKSPLELQAGAVRFFDLEIPDPVMDPFEAYITFYKFGMLRPLSDACFDLFDPPDVAGYPPVYQNPDFNRLWMNSKSLPARYKIIEEHIYGPDHLKFDLMTWVNDPANITEYMGNDPMGNPGPHAGGRIAHHLVQELIDYLLPEAIDANRFSYFMDEILLDNLSETSWMFEWDTYINSGDDTAVRLQIEKLVRGILQSPEYQLY
ncbi:MAG: DUF1800 family protein [Bacteroidota bacterium]